MEFCPNCEVRLKNDDGLLSCPKCKYVKEISDKSIKEAVANIAVTDETIFH